MEEQLSALDATFLELEEADLSAHMHIGSVVVLEPQPDGGAPPIDQIRKDVLARLPDLPRYPHRPLHPADRRLPLAQLGGGHWLPRRASRPHGRAARARRLRRAVGLGRGVLLRAARPHQAPLGDRRARAGRRPLGLGHQDAPLHDRRSRLRRHRDHAARYAAGAARLAAERRWRVERKRPGLHPAGQADATRWRRRVSRVARPTLARQRRRPGLAVRVASRGVGRRPRRTPVQRP